MEIKDFGQIKSITLPEGWVESEQRGGQLDTRVNRRFHAQGVTDASIDLYYRGRPIADRYGKAFLDVLQSEPHQLETVEVKGLSDVMNLKTVGDNQFTNQSGKGTPAFPVFNLAQAETVKLNGRTVLKVSGHFQDQNGTPDNYYHGIFIPASEDGTQIEEVYLSAKTRGKFLLYGRDFDKVLASLQF